MSTYTIQPLKVGSIQYYRGAFNSNREQYKEKETFPVIIFLIEGNGKKILVDTGCGDPDTEWMKESFHGPSKRLSGEAPDRALAAIGVKTEDIDVVVMTHLHWDHCYNNHLFPQAEFYVQRKEMMNAIDPLPNFRITYEAFSTGVIPPWARQKTKWKIIDGEHCLMEGISLIPIPGHSLGLQGVLVDTEKGPYFLASDAIPLYDNCENNDFIVSGLAADLEQYYKSFEKMQQMKAVIIPSHDSRVFDHRFFPDEDVFSRNIK